MVEVVVGEVGGGGVGTPTTGVADVVVVPEDEVAPDVVVGAVTAVGANCRELPTPKNTPFINSSAKPLPVGDGMTATAFFGPLVANWGASPKLRMTPDWLLPSTPAIGRSA